MIADQPSALDSPALKRLLLKKFGRSHTVRSIAGDASTRRFYRVSSGRRRAVLIVHPDPLVPDSPLYSNHRLLRKVGAPVPRILGSDNARGCVLMEDCGDTTLQGYLAGKKGRPRAAWSRLYRQACDLIVLMQARAAGALRPGDFAAGNALDRDRFLFELDHFHRHFIGALRGLTPEGADAALLREFYDDLAGACDRLPRVYCHRDFQSRNLMVERGRLRLIDFQDARMGPYTYDAASLLRDSSLDIEEGLVEELLVYLSARLDAAPEEFRRDFDLMALQRNIKDLGTFGYMATARGARAYLDYVPRTLRSIRATLLASDRYHDFYPVLDRFILSYR